MRRTRNQAMAVFGMCIILGGGRAVAERVNEDVTPLPRAHAHNDYHHDRPLADALARGFCSVEADVFVIKDTLLVGHSIFELRKGRTLEKLYLEPLKKRIAANGGRVFPHGPPFMLLIDVKVNADDAYRVLAKKLEKYHDMLAHVKDGKYHPGAVQIVISGARAKALITSDKNRRVAIDGRLGDLNSSKPAHLYPLISDRWSSHFAWRGQGEFPARERRKLHEIVAKAHASGRRVRFWATPESPSVWRELLEAKVDHINTDQLEELSRFLRGDHP